MTANEAIVAGQQMAEAQMLPGAIITRITHVTDPVDRTTSETDTAVYGGPDCPWSGLYKLSTYEPDAVVYGSGGRYLSTQELRLHVPVGAGPFQIGDVAVVPEFPDRRFRVDGLLIKTYMTSQRLRVTVIADEEEE